MRRWLIASFAVVALSVFCAALLFPDEVKQAVSEANIPRDAYVVERQLERVLVISVGIVLATSLAVIGWWRRRAK